MMPNPARIVGPYKVILITPVSNRALLPEFVEDWLRNGVPLVCVFGSDALEVEEEIDWLLVGRPDLTDAECERRYITTTAHDNETFEEVAEFAETWSDVCGVSIVRI